MFVKKCFAWQFVLFLSVFLLFSQAVFAEGLKGVATLGADFGGDTLLSIRYSDGSTSTLKAGNGLLLSGGILYSFNNKVQIQSTIGIKYHQTQDANNQSVVFNRYPIEVLGFYNLKDISTRLGAGLAYHVSPNIDASGAVANGTINFDSALGFFAEADFVSQEKLFVGVRYISIKYTTTATSVDASGLGFQLGFIF